MTRDITDRLEMFAEQSVEIKRIALNWDQVQQYNPPPNPAKLTDSRVGSYLRRFGSESWELDALEPRVISDLIRTAVLEVRNEDQWDKDCAAEEEDKADIKKVADNWYEVTDFASTLKGD